MAPTQRDSQYHTYGEYLEWSDESREELIDGIAYVREPPAPSRLHQDLVGELHYQIRAALEGKPYRVYISPFDVRLPKFDEVDEKVDTVVQPDLLIVCNRDKLDARGMRGAPDWLAEVLSPSTARHNQIIKLPAYERAGVREVWFVHPILRTLTLYQLENGHYGRPISLELKGQTPLAAVPDVRIDWDRLLSQLM